MLDFQQKIEQFLWELNDPWLCAAFASRIVTRGLPALIDGLHKTKLFLWFWPEEKRAKYLLNILRAWQAVWGTALLRHDDVAQKTATDAFAVARVYANTDLNIANNAEKAVRAVLDAAAIPRRPEDAVSAAVEAACKVCSIFPELEEEALNDLKSLKKITKDEDKKDEEIRDFLQRPFVPIQIQQESQITFVQELHKLGNDFDYWISWLQDRYTGKPIASEALKNSVLLSNEIVSLSPQEINIYLKSLNTATTPLNRVRAIFIGFGAAGKTSLIHVLNDEPVVEGKEEMTPGIDISDWNLPGSKIKAHLWDFGGQVMAHATHQFFLRSSCVYVLVLDGRTEINANAQAEYWLEHVRAFGGGAPVLLVGNKSDQTRVNLDLRYLKDKYPNIVDFYPLSCTRCDSDYRRQFEIFRDDFVARLQAVGTHQVMFTPQHFAVLEALRERSPKEVFLKKTTYERLCGKHKVAKRGGLDREWLLDLLDKLGVVIHFPRIPTLNAFLLNPRWLTYGVYTLLYNERALRQYGRLCDQDVIDILQAEQVTDNLDNVLRYEADKCRFIVDAMEQFQLCYRLSDTPGAFIVPDLLPSDRPEHLDFDKRDALVFDFDFEGLLPRHLMSAFIVRRHGEIVDGLVWQNGVRLRSVNGKAEALMQADYHERRFSLWVEGEQAQHFFYALYDTVLHLLEKLDLRYREWVHLPGNLADPARRAPFKTVLAMSIAGQKHYVCEYGTYELAEVLKIMPKEKQQEQGVNIHIGGGVGNFNYAGGNQRDVRVGDDNIQVQVQQQAAEMNKRLGALEDALAIEVADDDLRGAALRELKLVRDSLRKVEQEQVDAGVLEKLSRFGDRIKEGGSKLVDALKTLEAGGDAVQWLQAAVPSLIAGVAAWLG